MSQIIEGVDNEVTLTFSFLTIAAAVLIPWYFMRPPRPQGDPTIQDSSGRASQNNTESNAAGSNGEGETRTQQSPNVLYPSVSDADRISRNDVNNLQRTSTPSHHGPPPVGFRSEFFPQQSPIQPTERGTSETADEFINIRVKLISDSERPFNVPKSMPLIEFKKLCFPEEFNQGKLIRFIYSGRILQGDNEPLSNFRITDGSVVHAQISQRQNTTADIPSSFPPDDLDLSSFLVPVLTFALILGWVAIFTFDGIFTWTSIFILGFLTVMMIVTNWL